MEGIAIELMKTRKRPSHPEYMQSSCPILATLAARGGSVHGFSTMLMVSMFKSGYIAEKLPAAEFARLTSFIHTGLPLRRSFYDGVVGAAVAAVPCESKCVIDIEAYRCVHDDPSMNGGELFDVPSSEKVPRPPAVWVPDSNGSSDDDLKGTGAVTSVSAKRYSFTTTTITKWSIEEDAFVEEFYNAHGGQWRNMARAMSSAIGTTRSDDALRNLAHAHDGSASVASDSSSVSSSSTNRSPRVPWTTWEDTLIVETLGAWRGRVTWKRLAGQLPGRTPHAIRNRAHRLAMDNGL